MYNIDAIMQQIHKDACNGVQPVPRHETIPLEDIIMTEVEQAYIPANATADQFVFGTGEFQPLHTYTVDEVTRAKTFIEAQKTLCRQEQMVSNVAISSISADVLMWNNAEADLASMISKLNTEQRFAYNIVRYYILRDGTSEHKQLRMFISGPGGTGKSFLINTIAQFIRLHYGNTGRCQLY